MDQQESSFDQTDEQTQQIEQQQQPQQQQLQQPIYDNTQIVITVSDPMIKDSGLSKHTVYNLKGEDANGKFDVYRRYTDFHELREQLAKKWPGCYIPPIPEKQVAGGNDQDVVQLRKRLLFVFVQTLTQLPHLFYSEDFNQVFLRSGEPGKTYSQQKQPTTQENIERMKAAFPSLEIRDQSNSEYVLAISTFQGQLRKSQTFLKQYIEQAQAIALSRKTLNEARISLFSQILPQYEKFHQNEYVGGKEQLLVFTNPENAAINQHIEQMKDNSKECTLDLLTDLFRFENKDAEAIQQALNQREILQSSRSKLEQKVREDQGELAKISAGKQTLTTITSSVFNKSKDQAQVKVETRILENQHEIERLSELANIVTAILVTQEIANYKRFRIGHFHKVMQIIQKSETNAIEPENQVYGIILEASRKLLQEI